MTLDEATEVAWKISSLQTHCNSLERQLAAVTAERNDLKAELAAVPLAALRYRLANSEQSPECWGDWDNRGEAYEKATNEIDAWLKRSTTQ